MSGRIGISAVGPLLALAAIAGCTWAGGGDQRETVALRFDWPVGLTAFVETERSTRTTGSLGPSSTTVRMSYRIDVEEAPDGRLIRYGDIRVEDPDNGQIYPLDELPEPLASQLIALFPSYVVNDEGQLVRLEGFEALIEEARRKLESRLAELPPESAEARVLAASGISEERLLAAAREHWDQLAGAWSGATLVMGETYQRKDRLVVPRSPLRILSAVDYGVGQRIPCTEETIEVDCVEIEVRSRPVPEALAQLEKAMRERSREATPGGFGVLENLQIEESSYLVAEPSTLIPHYLETTTKFHATLLRPGEADTVITDLDQHVYRYHYAQQGEAAQ
jgi:hypothetical protein